VQVDLWIWISFIAGILAMLAIDLFVFHRDAHEVSLREAGMWSAIWIALGLSFGALIWVWMGPDAGGQYFAGYLIEKSLSVDNIFVFALLFSYFAVPAAYQHRVLFWGVVGALVLRAAFIAAGATLLDQFHWTIYVFGAFLVFTGVRMARSKGTHVDPGRNPLLRLMQNVLPITEEYRGQRILLREKGRLVATPLLAVLVIVETTDVIFAVDSIPAIFAVTRDTFLVFTSNAFAILGLRALYFVLAGMIGRFVYLRFGLAAVLVWVGAKMLLADVWHVPIWVSLLVIVATIGVSIVASFRRPVVVAGTPPTTPPVPPERATLPGFGSVPAPPGPGRTLGPGSERSVPR
jgi:tellurite resistance protein TerC